MIRALLRPAVLLLAAVVSAPALWDALASGTLPLGDALRRYLVAVPLAAVAVAAVEALLRSYGRSGRQSASAPPARRRDDPGGPATPNG